MTTPTYSIGKTGALYDNAQRPTNIILPDVDEGGININTNAGQHQSQQLGNRLLCKGPDGALHWYKLALRSTVANTILLYVGP